MIFENAMHSSQVLHISSQVSQYGHMDNWAVSKLVDKDVLKEMNE